MEGTLVKVTSLKDKMIRITVDVHQDDITGNIWDYIEKQVELTYKKPE